MAFKLVPLKRYKDSTRPAIRLRIKGADITGGTLTFQMTNVTYDTKQIDNGSGTIVEPNTSNAAADDKAIIEYRPSSGDFNTVGAFHAQFKLVLDGETFYYPKDEPLVVNIVDGPWSA